MTGLGTCVFCFWLNIAALEGLAKLIVALLVMQALIGDSLQAVFPPNTTFLSVNLEQQISADTVIVGVSFVIWEVMIPILLANKCCALEVLYLQHAVARISPNVIGATCLQELLPAHHVAQGQLQRSLALVWPQTHIMCIS